MNKDKDTDLIYNVKLVEKYKMAIPEMERMLEFNAFYYMAGSLILNIKDPLSDRNFMSIDIKDINAYESKTIRYGQYLASKLFVKHKEGSCFYGQALKNVEDYEEEMETA